MRRFEHYYKDKMEDPAFKALYKQECHVCAKTVQIFARTEKEKVPLSQLAKDAGVDAGALKALRDADYCDPELVIHLCRHLGLPTPEDCPRLGKHK